MIGEATIRVSRRDLALIVLALMAQKENPEVTPLAVQRYGAALDRVLKQTFEVPGFTLDAAWREDP